MRDLAEGGADGGGGLENKKECDAIEREMTGRHAPQLRAVTSLEKTRPKPHGPRPATTTSARRHAHDPRRPATRAAAGRAAARAVRRLADRRAGAHDAGGARKGQDGRAAAATRGGARERLRLQVLDLALEDFSSQAKPIALAAAIEEAKRRDAALAVQRVEEAYTQQRSQLLNRWYEPSLEERAEREYLFEQRRYEFGLQRDARRAMQQMTIDARTMELARQSEEKLERARTRQSAFMESRVASCQALNSSASAPQLAEPVRTASY